MREIVNEPFYEINNCIDLLRKLTLDFERLNKEDMSSYDLFNFLTTANHMKDWVLNDEQINKEIKEEVKIAFDTNRNMEYGIWDY
jgi:hypothetical protein